MANLDHAISIKYMVAGYSVIFIILTIYLASLKIRWQRLKNDLQTLEELDRQQTHSNPTKKDSLLSS
jgi:hypothetical protein